MPDKQTILKISVFILCTISSGLMYFFSTGVEGIKPLVWAAPIPVLFYSLTVTQRTALASALVAYFLGNLNLVPYLVKITPLWVIIIYIAWVSSIFSLVITGFRFTAKKYNNIIPAVFFASAWTSWEFLLSLVSPHGTAFSIAYTQSDFLPFIQLSSVTGLWGLTFLLLFIPACLVIAWQNREDKLKTLKIFLTPLMIIFLVFSSGYIRLHNSIQVKTVHAGLAASDTSIGFFATTDRREALSVIRAFEKRIDVLAYEGVDIIVLPEKLVGVTPEYHDEVIGRLKLSCRRNKVILVAGLNLSGPDKNRNQALVISSKGEILCDYDKRYFIPGAERGYSRGAKPGIFDLTDIKAGVQICKDMDFPGWSKKYSRAGVRIMFVPAWDFTVDAWLHSRMAVMRAVENGFSLVRCAQQGNLTITDYRGKVIAEGSTINKTDLLVEGNVIPGPGNTFYSRMGDWFAWMNVLFIIIILLYPQAIKIINRISKKGVVGITGYSANK